MRYNQNIPYYISALGLFILMKLGYKYADTQDLIFLLKPTNKLVEILIGSKSTFITDRGFYHDVPNIIIDKSCAGFNFWVITFLVFSYLLFKYLNRSNLRLLVIPIALLSAYLLTILVNASRIFVSIILQAQTQEIFLPYQNIIHEGIGVITNLSFLILAYLILEKLLIYTHQHAKIT